jgi:hypothetical protein
LSALRAGFRKRRVRNARPRSRHRATWLLAERASGWP